MADAQKVDIPILWDAINSFRDNEIYSVAANSLIMGTVAKPSGIGIKGYPQPMLVETLAIKDPSIGTVYSSLSLAEYLALIGLGESSSSATDVINWVGGTDIPAGDTISSPELSSIAIISINKGGIAIYNFTYTDGIPNGEIDLTLDGGLADGEPIQIIYKRI